MHRTRSTIAIHAPAARVWDALVSPAKVKRWQYGSDLVTSWEPGTPIRFSTPWGESTFEQWGTVLEVTPNKALKYSLFAPRPGLEDRPENYFVMMYLLEDHGDRTTLSIVQEDPRPQGQADDVDDGGNAILEGLKALVEGE